MAVPLSEQAVQTSQTILHMSAIVGEVLQKAHVV